MSLLLPAAVFFLDTTVGTVCGFGLAALLTAGKLADIETERAEWERIAVRGRVLDGRYTPLGRGRHDAPRHLYRRPESRRRGGP